MATGNQTQDPSSAGHPEHSAWFNWVTLIGGVLAIGGVALAPFVFLVEIFVPRSPAYVGLLYVPILGAIVLGTLMVPCGYLLATRKRARGKNLNMPVRISIDLTDARHRYVLAGLAVGGVLAALVLTTGTFSTYEAMETDAFCGQMCHRVMAPEATAHRATAHAEVRCVECHVGSGVGHYVEAKFNGMRQLALYMTGGYHRPIPAPVFNMRPANEICQSCHNINNIAGLKEKVFTYFASGEKSPEHKLRMLMKVGGGGGDSLFIKGFGIHYHMQVARKVEYVARDAKRQQISWVRVTAADGTVTEYNHKDYPITPEQRQTLKPRVMDCMDCHNRVGHDFKSPIDAVDQGLASGKVSHDLPFIKVQAVKALDGSYATEAEAVSGINDSLTGFYKNEHPEVLEKEGALVKSTVAALQGIYDTSFFPEMKAKWSAYPNNLSHRDWPGCFRCHTPNMVSASGKSPTTDCATCHLILAQDANVDKIATVNFQKGKPFDHPGYGDVITTYSKCIDCHTGGADLY